MTVASIRDAATAAAICECSLDVPEGYRVRAMPAQLRKDLRPDQFRDQEVIAVYLAIGLEGTRSQAQIDAFVARLLRAFPPGSDWVVEASPRRKLAAVPRSAMALDRKRRTARWISPRNAYELLRDAPSS